MNGNYSYERYHRQVILNQFGEAGQDKLLRAKVLVIGAGGLGCPVLQYLVAAGIGTIGIVDDDLVTLTNLHRQILFSVDDIGKSKAEIASFYLYKLNPEIEIIPFNLRITTENALSLLGAFDYIIDGTDDFATRYMINDACSLLKKPLIYGAVSKFEGQVAIFNCKLNEHDETVNYRDLFPYPPKEGEVLNCQEAGVLGVLAGIVGTMMASEAIKLIAGIGMPLINNLFTFNALTNQTYQIKIVPRKETPLIIPKNECEFKQTDYKRFCASSLLPLEIDGFTFYNFIERENVDIIDVRELDEIPEVNEFVHLQIPMADLEMNISKLTRETVILFCQSGNRSLRVAKKLDAIFKRSKMIYSLKGGIVEWKQLDSKQKS